ncbi:MAG TPA: SMP-30/gluconolactonase/LRE family protein [Burkholderiales bacterium]
MSLFPPPTVIATEVFARIPDQYRKKGVFPHWVQTHRGGAPTECYLEGPSFDRAGNLYITDIPFGRVFRISPQGDVALIAEYDGEPNGLKIHKDGRIFITDHAHGIMLLDPASGKVGTHLSRRDIEGFKGVNDLVFAANGDMYFTDQGETGMHDPSGRVYRLTPEGRLQTVLANLPSPNGLVFNPAGNILHVACTRANAVWRLPIAADGSTSKVNVGIYLSGGSGPDGLAMDEAGGLTVAHNQMGAVWLFDRKGIPRYKMESCKGDHTTNIAYGGPGNKFLYICEAESGCVLRAEAPVAGRLMYSHM